MQDRSVEHSTFVIERDYAAAPEKVFAAFADPAKKRRWYAESRTHDVEEYAMDFRVGGVDKGVYRFKEGTPFPGAAFINITTYQDIVPNQRIVMAYTMAMGDHPFSASLATVELLANGSGTHLVFTEQAAFFKGSDGAEMRKGGWTKLLESLAAELDAQHQ